MAAAGLIYLLVMLLTAATAAAFVGVPLLAAGVPGARGLGAVDRGPARALPGVEVPVPPRFRPRPGLIGRLGSALGDTSRPSRSPRSTTPPPDRLRSLERSP
ncbi:sensor domain-containing protein [Streptosporangium roseum]|uniref:sensor domain-containing protein n=1 Tax=Streptosporangium roseum TaxID=2001 RepID=UPI0005B8E911|nr:sensor domain-containing protein [Streptosporangium roseum]